MEIKKSLFPIKNLALEITHDFTSARLLPVFTSGLVVGLV